MTQNTFKINHQFNCSKKRLVYLNDVSIAFIDKTDPFDPLRREDFWRQTLKTMASYGPNIEDFV